MIALALPLAVPFIAAAGLWLVRSRPEARRALSLGAAAAQVALAVALFAQIWSQGVVAQTMGGWPAPFGITLVADTLSAGLLLVASAIWALALVFGLADVTEEEERRGFSALAHALIGGVVGAFLTGDLFNLYVWFEVTLVFDLGQTPALQTLLLWIACITMVIGALGAAAQTGVRKILSFHIVSQIGYMGLGLALATPLGIAAGLFHLVHNMLAKTNLFLSGALAARLAGSEELPRMGGLWSARPGLSLLFLISALAMAGIPPLSGFWAKFLILRESFDQGLFLAGSIALGTGLLTLYSMTKIWSEAFWKPHPDDGWRPAAAPRAMVFPVAAIAGLVVIMGLFVAPLHAVAVRAAEGLTDRSAYLTAVLGDRS